MEGYFKARGSVAMSTNSNMLINNFTFIYLIFYSLVNHKGDIENIFIMRAKNYGMGENK